MLNMIKIKSTARELEKKSKDLEKLKGGWSVHDR